MGSVLVTGAAGFIGSHLVRALLARGETVTGIDNLNPYYDPALKHGRLEWIRSLGGQFEFEKLDLVDCARLTALLKSGRFDRVVHLGAQAGVRWSLEAPFAYTASNVTGHLSVLEAVRNAGGRIGHLVYASTSSVYGSRTDGPFKETDRTDRPASLYAATKKADELMSSVYTDLYGLPITGLRFFTVYGPWGRPDMAYWLFAEAIANNRPIRLFNNGKMERDFTYVDDVVAGVITVLDSPPSAPAHRVYNIGKNKPDKLMKLVETLERLLGATAVKELLPMQPGDVPATFADVTALERDFAWRPATELEVGLEHFVRWWLPFAGKTQPP
jgi:UDP-glucuronate 4-epimerase